eukprot:CAMPEP_0201475608 /NCGR_PEP_ID=MMETSP0151_2-20130828/995_1 /ASSEMBLY_ACC=CAM_ASM_000257 /TAXON_ID=200890 /ORGANISM="Paramoeba atlantica, Strain 621/1 / CCAP 1560/9" /LENGTH=99 /DNA_ID=CAMNT_0047855739 /DNA_START=77 /DNA_END=376 /DNA_ORIENTATION=-
MEEGQVDLQQQQKIFPIPGFEEEDHGDGFYAEIEIENMDFEEQTNTYYYPCPCGDRFQITADQLMEGEVIANCPSCTLFIRVLYELEEVSDEEEEEEED